MIPVSVVQALATVADFRRGGRRPASPEPVGPVPPGDVEKTLPHLSRTVAGLVRLQLLTGSEAGRGHHPARPGTWWRVRATWS